MKSEQIIQQLTRLESARHGLQIWRNNSGACVDDTGRLIRYGLGNDSAQLNAVIKSSDLIGIMPVRVGPEHIGRVLGVFTALECKHEGWRRNELDARASAQAKFHDIVRAVGGFAGFVSNPLDIYGFIK